MFTRRTDQIDHALYHLDPSWPLQDVVQDLCIVQIQPRKYLLDHAGYSAPIRQRELVHTDHTDHADHAPNLPCLADLGHELYWETIICRICGYGEMILILTDHTDQESICPERSRSWTVLGIYRTDHTDHADHLSEACNCVRAEFVNSKQHKQESWSSGDNHVNPGTVLLVVRKQWRVHRAKAMVCSSCESNRVFVVRQLLQLYWYAQCFGHQIYTREHRH